MRITRNQLTDLINEEISSALLERQNRRLLEEFESELSSQLTLQSMLAFAKKYHEVASGRNRFLVGQLNNIIDERGETMIKEDVAFLMGEFGGMITELDDLFTDAMASAQTYEDEDNYGNEDDDGTYAAAYRANR
jgi:hypothetical protein